MNGSDEQLYERFLKEGSEDALLMLVKRHRESLVLFINGYVHDMNTAEELSLDAFAEVAAGPTFFSAKSSFRTWLFSIGRHQALMYLRKLVPMEELDESTEAGADSPELEILKNERNRMLYEALSKLNEDYRRILLLLYFEEMTAAEAARVIGKNKKQVYNLAERGKKALKDILLKMGFTYELDQ